MYTEEAPAMNIEQAGPRRTPIVNIVNPDSMSLTLDALNEALIAGVKLSRTEKEPAAKWIAGRAGLRLSYAGMPAPTDKEYADGVRTFTGEPVKSGASTGHILGEEACRMLVILDVSVLHVENVLEKATRGMMARLLLPSGEPNPETMGEYCCGQCSVAYWRHLAVGGLQDSEKRLAAGMELLKEARKGDGQWKRFPFHYTLLALSEMKSKLAMEEMRYAAPVAERYVKKRVPAEDIYEVRRRALAARVLEKI